jgi:hypothetical protein
MVWWFDDAPKNISEGTLARNGFCLLYVGVAPSAPPKEGISHERCATGCSTIVMVLSPPRRFGARSPPFSRSARTFRLGAQHPASRMSAEDEAKLTGWMARHAHIT